MSASYPIASLPASCAASRGAGESWCWLIKAALIGGMSIDSAACLSPVDFEGEVYPTVEHAFAAAKTLDPTEREVIRLAPRPGDAKRLGRQVALRSGWDDLRVGVMRGLLARKFAPATDLAARLLATGDAQLVEGNTWGDRFWGVCRGQGGINSANCSWNGVTSCGAAPLPSTRLAASPLQRSAP